MNTEIEQKKYSWGYVVAIILCIPILHYLAVSFGEVATKSTEYMQIQYPFINKIMRLGAFPYFFVLLFVFSYAKCEEYLGVDRKNYRKNIKPNLLLKFIFICVLTYFCLYHIFWIYIYIKHFGDNPFLSWKEYINSPNFFNFK
jgi:hypothetical protein